MFKQLKNALSVERIKSIDRQVIDASRAGDDDKAWQFLRPLLRAQRHQPNAADCLVSIVSRDLLPIDRALEVLAAVYESNSKNESLLAAIGSALNKARDIDQLNAGPPDHPLFLEVVDRLTDIADKVHGQDVEVAVLDGLAGAARIVGHQRNDVAERAYRRLVALGPEDSWNHYNLGLFYKTRGRFREGMLANQAGAKLLDKPEESYEWNLGICATGAGEGALALDVWLRMGQKIKMGRFDLPDGGYPQCKVKSAERPLAERTAETDDAGLEETIWIQRLSPCHGIVRSVLFQNLGVDFGDVVLFDGAPITYHTYDDEKIPVFPHLATLVRRQFQLFDFAGTQDAKGRIADVSNEMEEDSIVYSHSENYRTLCASCWRDPDLDHADHSSEQMHVVRGRIAAPAHVDPLYVLQQIDAGMAERKPCRIYSADLCLAAGLKDRAAIEKRRFDMLMAN
jgi:hypothetical protein